MRCGTQLQSPDADSQGRNGQRDSGVPIAAQAECLDVAGGRGLRRRGRATVSLDHCRCQSWYVRVRTRE